MNQLRFAISRPTRLFALLAPFLVFKLNFYITDEPLTGWDTIGHLHLARIYYETLLATGGSLGYDPGWFQGFPLFYFYPPAFYFLVAQLVSIGGASIELAFHLTILGSLLFFSWNYLRWLDLFVPHYDAWIYGALGSLGLIFYFSYSGDSLQGVGLIGVLGGTIVAGFAHGLVLMAFTHLELHRRTRSTWRLAQCVLSLTLLVLTHYLSTAFCYLLIALYCVLNRNSISVRTMLLLLAPLVLAFPVPYNFLKYNYLSSGASIIQYYPALLSILGSDFFQRLSVDGHYAMNFVREILIYFKWLNLLLIVAWALALRRLALRRRKPPLLTFVALGSFLFLWISQDTSLSNILHPLGIHWYRVFDLAYAGLIVVAMLGLAALFATVRRQNRWRARLLAVALSAAALLRFLVWDPGAHSQHENMRLYGSANDAAPLEKFLADLEPGSLILPEKIADRKLFGSPHSFDYFIQKHGHRNALGLTIESSLTPLVTNAWVSREFPRIFVWGVDRRWETDLYRNASPAAMPDALPAYLRRAGIQYILGRSPEAFAYMRDHPENFEMVLAARDYFAFRVRSVGARIQVGGPPPIGYLSLRRVREASAGRGLNRRDSVREFLLHANQLRLRDGLRDLPPIINLDPAYPDWNESHTDLAAMIGQLGALILFHEGPGLMPSGMSHEFASYGVPLILVNFEKTGPDPGPVRYVYTIVQVPSQTAPGRAAGATRPDRSRNTTKSSPPASVTALANHRIVLTVPADRGAAPQPPGGAAQCVPVELRQSYFPDWRLRGEADGRPIFQTDTNHMLVCGQPGETLEFLFDASFARTITFLLYFVTGLLLLSGPARWAGTLLLLLTRPDARSHPRESGGQSETSRSDTEAPPEQPDRPAGS